MTRQIHGAAQAAPDTPVESASAAASAAPEPVPATIVTTAEHCDALAGALPAWDLLPAAPFIRRVR
ncbi:hypothetical protein [Achromobacter insuavis]|uniref:hypothetical protein n=1 Tax=Achromobacter insuavis TaxID=1287735 RepID=UPI001F1485E7|nr:hypothetical protein [Achromobacter insuavis]